MVNLAFWLMIGAGGVAALDSTSDADADRVVRNALARGRYRWYDAKADAAEPVWPARASKESDRLARPIRWLRDLDRLRLQGFSPGELVVTSLVVLALAIVLVVLMELWRRSRPIADEPAREMTVASVVGPVKGLPAGVRPETNDPWSEAIDCRERGDYAGATVCLFAHQLLVLQRLRLLRLAPGRTGRQLVRAIDDPRHRRPIEATLQLFEGVYYGHLRPTAETFESVWTLAEEFEQVTASGSPS